MRAEPAFFAHSTAISMFFLKKTLINSSLCSFGSKQNSPQTMQPLLLIFIMKQALNHLYLALETKKILQTKVKKHKIGLFCYKIIKFAR